VIEALVFLYGLVVGSFLNVCIHRLPRHESVVRPRSRCPQCGQAIAAYDNIPLVSYLLLRGRCRHCRAPISPLYFCVELATGLLAVYLYSLFGLTAAFAKAATLGAGLLVLTVTDWQERLLPDRVTFPGMAAGLVFSQIVPIEDGMGRFFTRLLGLDAIPVRLDSLLDSLIGAGLGAGLLYLLGEVYFRLRGREGMGFGDVKMMAMVGFFLGPQLALLTIFLGSAAGSVLGLAFIAASGKSSVYELPFGSFLGMAALVAAIWGKALLAWYLGYFP
jgi:leader peptidase (prepilin peptidase)/N-methyltransferase